MVFGAIECPPLIQTERSIRQRYVMQILRAFIFSQRLDACSECCSRLGLNQLSVFNKSRTPDSYIKKLTQEVFLLPGEGQFCAELLNQKWTRYNQDMMIISRLENEQKKIQGCINGGMPALPSFRMEHIKRIVCLVKVIISQISSSWISSLTFKTNFALLFRNVFRASVHTAPHCSHSNYEYVG